MRAISLWQPWATLVAVGAKSFETRHWRSSYTGPVLIHAALHSSPMLRDLVVTTPFREELVRAGPIWPGWSLNQLGGHVVATARIIAYERTEHIFSSVHAPRAAPHEREFGDYSPGRWAWVFADMCPLVPPFPLRGRQGLFDPELPP